MDKLFKTIKEEGKTKRVWFCGCDIHFDGTTSTSGFRDFETDSEHDVCFNPGKKRNEYTCHKAKKFKLIHYKKSR